MCSASAEENKVNQCVVPTSNFTDLQFPIQCKLHSESVLSSRVDALQCILLAAAAYNWKKLAAVLSNFLSSQYFRYFAAKCDLNTTALCWGWAQIHTYSLMHPSKNGFKGSLIENCRILQYPTHAPITVGINVLLKSVSVFCAQIPLFFYAIAFFCFLVQFRALPKTEAPSSARNKDLVKRRWLLTFSLYLWACKKSITTFCLWNQLFTYFQSE